MAMLSQASPSHDDDGPCRYVMTAWTASLPTPAEEAELTAEGRGEAAMKRRFELMTAHDIYDHHLRLGSYVRVSHGRRPWRCYSRMQA